MQWARDMKQTRTRENVVMRQSSAARGRVSTHATRTAAPRGLAQAVQIDCAKGLHALAVVVVETPGCRAVDVPHAYQFTVAHQGHHDFRARRRIAGDMTGKGKNVWHQLGLALAGGGTADAAVQRDAHAGRLA